jgi:hypothetical protein
MDIEEYNRLTGVAKSAQDEAYRLAEEIRQVRADTFDPTGYVRQVAAQAREIVRFATGNLGPETYAGWPTPALRAFADLLEAAPGAPGDYVEMAVDFRHYATEADKYAAARG